MPADPTKQDAWFKSIDATFPGIKLDWSVPQAMLAYPDVPNHQSWVPNYAKAKAALQAFQNKYRTTSGLDIDAELTTLQTTLQGIFDEPRHRRLGSSIPGSPRDPPTRGGRLPPTEAGSPRP